MKTTDWSKVPVNAKLFCKNVEHHDNVEHIVWYPRHFAEYRDGVIFVWSDGRTSFTASPIHDGKEAVNYAILAEEEECISSDNYPLRNGEEEMEVKRPKPGKRYRHFKGGEYLVLAIAKHTETGEDMVIYDDFDKPEIYVRPLSSWIKPVKTERFVEVEE